MKIFLIKQIVIALLSTSLIVIFPNHINAQYLQDEEMNSCNNELRVIASPYLNVREFPSSEANIIGRLPYNTKLDTIESMYYQDINDILNDNGFYPYASTDYASWSKIIVNGNKGYIDHSYLRMFVKQPKTPIAFQWLCEGEGQGIIDYDSTLNWYGVYASDKNKRVLKKVNITIQYPLKTDPDYSPDYVIRTDKDTTHSMFLIGLRTLLSQGLLVDTVFSGNYDMDSTVVYIYPGEVKNFKLSNGNSISFKAETEKITNSDYGKRINNSLYKYILKVSNAGAENKVWQAISDDIPGAAGAVFFNKPENYYFQGLYAFIYWIGDLDGDSKLDFIVNSGLNREACDQWHTSTLFLSSVADSGKIVKGIPFSME